MLDKISAALGFYVIAWLVFAVFDFNGSDTIVAYQLMPTVSPGNDLPRMISVNPTTYRVSDQSVVGQVADFEPTRYTDCAVIDVENWICTYDDKSGKFGFRDGEYYSVNLAGSGISDADWESVSRFGYIWNNIEWNLAEESWLQKATVLFIPFFV